MFIKKVAISIALSSIFINSTAIANEDEDEEKQFSNVSVIFEQNASDGDAEVVFEIKGVDEGLETLLVMSPNGRIFINSSFAVGMRQFVYESPEPEDQEIIKAAYPQGEYLFYATTLSGTFLAASANLSHTLPEPTIFISPAEEATNVQQEASLNWGYVDNVSSYIVVVENDDLDALYKVKLPGNTTSVGLPSNFLQANTEYEYQIGTVSASGNTSFVETTFTTGNF